MSRLQSNCILVAITAAITASCIFLFNGCQPIPQLTAPLQTACPDAAEQTAPVEDLRAIAQDMGPLAESFSQPLSAEAAHRLKQQFDRRYFAPWTSTEPLFKLRAVAGGIERLADRTWYGENRLRIEPERMQQLLALTDREHLPSTDQPGIVVKPAFVRVLPTIRPFYEAPDDAPFDQLQFAEIKPNEPVRILHASKDGAWLYIEASYANGWVEPDAVRLADAALRDRLRKADQLVVVKDFAEVRTEKGKILPQPKIGTLYPLIGEEQDHWLVEAVVGADDRRAVFTVARIAKADARRHPLPFTPEAVADIGNQLLKTPYGWGEMYRNRDCSATTRDFLLAFGIWLPRNSSKQINAGPSVPLTGLSAIDKETRIREQGVPFRTLLHLPGHIMLYAGLRDGKPVALHTIWALRAKTGNCPEQKYIIGRTVLTTLEAGKELPLSKGTLLDRLDRMLVLPVAD
ncbi:MAG: SH3 domain-containing protein [Desulfobulbus sp.]|jgi:cell wall-associated NlpC family hydrolase|uniref:NlpC/P60 family N-terminal domain-containing protein n=1 Tax=Desulfobulbus sp. TaxID=895 RepID=UPI00284D1E58|nr:NlpC/P60 family N-terminal domain-containing protein [Desulfobulbus sp.]MDR2550936.1 SH3 domain-containing protein [Desulfobulbus sp.]